MFPGPTACAVDVSPAPAKIAALDGLRGLACLLVLLWHYGNFNHDGAWPWWYELLHHVGGLNWIGVDLFFVLSGYLLGGICLKQRNACNYLSVFYARRACRILPLYYVLLALWLLLPAVVDAQVLSNICQEQEPAWPYAIFMQNGYFAAVNSYGSAWMVMTWSLAVEIQFYLILPALLRRLPDRWLLGFVGAAVALAVVVRTIIVLLVPSHVMAAYWLLPCRADALFLGVLAAYWGQQPLWRDRLNGPWLGWVRAAFGVSGGVLLGFLIAAPSKQAPLMASVGYSVVGVFFFCLLLLVLHDDKFARCFRCKPLCRLGTVSYGVYLFHLGIAGLLHGVLRQAAPALTAGSGLGVTLLAVGATLLFARLAFTWVEAPMVRLGQQWQFSDVDNSAAEVGTESVAKRPLAIAC
jgi:peptidoglycan/LPS O-acetylase OafA/YrhL